MVDEEQCRPPEGTRYDTMHWLIDPRGVLRLAAWKQGDCWRVLAGGADLGQHGWRYHKPEPDYDGVAAI